MADFSLVAPKLKKSNSKTKNTETYDGDFWWQIYEELKQLYNLKDLIAPLEEKRLKTQQEQTERAQLG